MGEKRRVEEITWTGAKEEREGGRSKGERKGRQGGGSQGIEKEML